jgi:hypothetical protein
MTLYIWVMALVFPLYTTENGYSNLGRDKYLFFRYVTLYFLAAVLLLLLPTWLVKARAFFKNTGQKRIRLSQAQLPIVAFLVIAGLSTAYAFFRATAEGRPREQALIAWHGETGWFLGLETYLLVMLTCLLIGSYWHYRSTIWLGFLVGAGIAFFIGICNRFSYYPFEVGLVAGYNANFISTLGNINWVAGFFAVLWPIGVGFYVFASWSWLRCLAALYTVLAMLLGLAQGSDSAIVSFVAVFYLLLLLCMGNWEKYGKAYLEAIIAWCLSVQALRALRVLLSERYNGFSTDGMGFLTESSLTLYLLLPVAILYILTARKNQVFLRIIDNKLLKATAIVVPLFAVVLFVLAVIVNTQTEGGVLGLGGSALFTFNDDWGSDRGFTWKIGALLFMRMGALQRLLGVGPDCFADFLYRFSDFAELCNERFGTAVLRNAHNEPLTILVNTGMFGLFAYLSIFVTRFTRLIKAGEARPLLYIAALCLFSYLLHNIFSFAQVLNLPYVFLIMAIGEAGIRRNV